jgi:GDP-4-dehydro-6-deoxy-D-mannose reductase
MRGPVLVTGAAGFAGSHLVDLLATRDVDIVAWHRPGGTIARSSSVSTPERPDSPGRRDRPDEPDAPDRRDLPDAPDWPDRPDVPDGSDMPDDPDLPHQPDRPERRERPGPPGRRNEQGPPERRDPPDRPDRPGLRWKAVDVLDRAAVREALAEARPAVVYHCAGAAHVGRAWETTEPTLAVNVRGTHHVVEALRAVRADARLLIPGSALVYAGADGPLSEDDPLRPSSPYGLSKLAQELVGTGNPGGPIAYLARPFNHFGPRQDPFFAASGFARAIAQIEAGRWEPELAVGNLDARRDLTDVRDTVRAYEAIVERGVPGRPYNVCSGRAVSIREVLDMLLARARAPIRVRVDPARYRPNDVPLLLGDNRRIRDELGWAPEIPIDRTLDDLLEYWRAQ